MDIDNSQGEPGGKMSSPDLNGQDFVQDIGNESMETSPEVADIPEESLEPSAETDVFLQEAADTPEEPLEIASEATEFQDELTDIPEDSGELESEASEFTAEVDDIPEDTLEAGQEETEAPVNVEDVPETVLNLSDDETRYAEALTDIPEESLETTPEELERSEEAVEASESLEGDTEGVSTQWGVEREVPLERGTNERPEVSDTPEKLPEIKPGRDNPPGTGNQPGDVQGDDSSDDSDRDNKQNEGLTRLTPLGPNDREAKIWNTEADAIEEHNRMMPGTAEGRLANFRHTMGWESTGDVEDEVDHLDDDGTTVTDSHNPPGSASNDIGDAEVDKVSEDEQTTLDVSSLITNETNDKETMSQDDNPTGTSNDPEQKSTVEELGLKLEESSMRPMEPEIDHNNIEYRIGSPHKDFEQYWADKHAREQVEVARRAQTANVENLFEGLPDAVDTTLRARNVSKQDESGLEAQSKEWLHLKHGSTPYTADAYPKEDEDMESTESIKSTENTDSTEGAELTENTDSTEDKESTEDKDSPKDGKS